MKRVGNLFDQIASLENLELADARARKGKLRQYGVRMHDRNREANLAALREQLLAGTYRTSAYTTFKIYEPKEREVFRLPYFPDRIAHHAIMNILEPIFGAYFTADTYSCVKRRGIHGAFRSVQRALQDEANTQYCLKLDIRKFYPSIRHNILKAQLRRKFKDERLLGLLDEIIDSAPGIPIGNYLSQYFANFYLSGFDHWLKEEKKVRYYFRYADDLVILAPDKASLHQLLADIQAYLADKLMLEVKGNYQIFPVDARGIDFVGYVFRHSHIRIRKSIKQNFARAFARWAQPATLASYHGWVCHCHSNHFLKKLLSDENIQRIQHRRQKRRLSRRQNKDRTHPKSAGDHLPVQDRGVEV